MKAGMKSMSQTTVAREKAGERPEAANQSFGQTVLFFLLRLSGTLSGFLVLAGAAWLHLMAKEHPNAELFSIILAELGAVLVSISILHFAYEQFLRQQHEDQMRGAFQAAFQREIRDPANLAAIVVATREDHKRYSTFLAQGVEAIVSFSSDELSKELKSAEHIRILKTWFPEENLLLRAFEEALKNRETKIELLLCDPKSSLLQLRSLGADKEAKEGRVRVVSALRALHRLRCPESDFKSCFHDNKDCNTKVGVYKAWPGCPVIWCDDRIFLGYYFLGQSSLQGPWMKVKPESELAAILERQFRLLWKDEDTKRFESCKDLAEWLTHYPKPARARRGRWQKQRKKPKQEVPAIAAAPDGS